MSNGDGVGADKATILISDRDYTSWQIDGVPFGYNAPTENSEERERFLTFNPLEKKIFTCDVIDMNTCEVVYSPVRNKQQIAGVLMLEGNKTFGRTANKKRLLYRCIPNDKYLPVFLVPYEIKLGFEKNTHNKYVVFEFDSWTAAEKHPHGLLVEVLGDVGELNAFYEYQLHCRSLNQPMTALNTSIKKQISGHIDDYKTTIRNCYIPLKQQEQTPPFIFTIDPKGSQDLDDAFSVCRLNETRTEISVYISNVYVWLDVLNLWSSLNKRVSTIYLPDKKRPMLAAAISDDLCSLCVGNKFVFAMMVEYSEATQTIMWETLRMETKEVVVNANFVYDSAELESNSHYHKLLQITRNVAGKYDTIKDSHDVVSFWMVQMNRVCGEKLFECGAGIFRTLEIKDKTKMQEQQVDLNISDKAAMCIKTWRNTIGKYCPFSALEDGQTHEMLKIEHYVQITSPIRRLVDLLNQMLFFKHAMGMSLSENAEGFLNGWLSESKMEYINITTRYIRKVQTDCEILYKCTQHPEWKETELDGVVFDEVQRSDGTYAYMVYLEQPQILTRVYSLCTLPPKYKFKIFLFDDETKLCTKVRVVANTH